MDTSKYTSKIHRLPDSVSYIKKNFFKHKLFHPNEIMNYIANMMYSVWKT